MGRIQVRLEGSCPNSPQYWAATDRDEGTHGFANRDDGRSRPETGRLYLLIVATIGSAAQKWRQRYARQGKVYLAPRRACAHRVSQVQGT